MLEQTYFILADDNDDTKLTIYILADNTKETHCNLETTLRDNTQKKPCILADETKIWKQADHLKSFTYKAVCLRHVEQKMEWENWNYLPQGWQHFGTEFIYDV